MRAARLVVLFGLLIAVSALSFGAHIQAGTPIDLNGGWTVQAHGGVELTCKATVEQTNNELHVQLSCPGLGDTPLEGSVDPTTRGIELDLDGERGLDIHLQGNVSADGGAVDGTWEWENGDDVSGTFHATRGLTPQPVPEISGTWVVETGRAQGLCQATFQQTGTDVQLDLQCPGAPPETFTGQLDGRVISLTAPNAEISATFSTDGLAVGGYWLIRTPCCDYGSFSALKQVDQAFDGTTTDDWRVAIESGFPGACDVAAEQSPTNELFAAFDCGLAGGYWLNGTIDPGTATFELEGIAGSSRDTQVIVRGLLGADGHTFAATFLAGRDVATSAFAGVLTGHQIDDSPSSIDISGTYELRLTTQFGEDASCSADAAQSQEVLSIPVQCTGVGNGRLNGWLSPLTGEMMLEGRVGSVDLSFEGNATDSRPDVLEGEWTSDQRYVEGCFTTDTDADCEQQGFRVSGDANCDGRTNSLDAALVLQVSAGLITYIDLCFDGSNVADLREHCCQVDINAVDAALILQIGAGLLGRLAG